MEIAMPKRRLVTPFLAFAYAFPAPLSLTPAATGIVLAPAASLVLTTTTAEARPRFGGFGGFHGGFGGGLHSGFGGAFHGGFHRSFGGFHDGQVANWGRHSLNRDVYRAGLRNRDRYLRGHVTNIDVNHHYNYAYRYPYGAYDYGLATGAALAIGTAVAALPDDCTTAEIGGIYYHHCGNVWYEPEYRGTEINYVVVKPPR